MKNIKHKFYILGIILTVIIALGLTIQYSYFNRVVNEVKQENILITREALAGNISSKIKYFSELIDTSSQVIENNNWDYQGIQEYVNGLAKSNTVIKSVYFADANNNLINSDKWNPPDDYNIEARSWYKRAIEKDSLVISEVYTSALHGSIIISISKPVYDENNKVVGVLSTDIDVEDIVDIVEETKMDGVGYSFLIDGVGNVLSHPNYDDISSGASTTMKLLDTSDDDILERMRSYKTGQIETELDNIKGYLTFKPIVNTDWIIGSFISYKEFKGDNSEMWRMFLIALLAAVIIFSYFTLIQRKNILGPLVQLDMDIKKIDIENNIDYRIPTENNDPFNDVKETLNKVLVKTQSLFEQVEHDKEEIIAQNDDLNYLSYNDQLTGLHNRRYFEKYLKLLNKEKNLPLTLLMGDANGLKLINDSFGHKAGDNLLITIGEILNEACRKSDIISRISGDEFVIILPHTNEEQAEEIIRRIKKASKNRKVISNGYSNIEVSVSYGYKTKHVKDTDIYETLNLAEENMYKSKLREGPEMRKRTMENIINELYCENKYKENHHKKVSKIARELGVKLGLSKKEIQDLESLGLVHDIGEIAVEKEILEKKEELSLEEWREIKKHPEIGYRILNTLRETSKLADYTLYHHERYDGQGYPQGLKGEDIPLLSRIITLADAYDAMSTNRPYRSALSKEEIITEFKENAGTQFDPELVEVFISQMLNKGWII